MKKLLLLSLLLFFKSVFSQNVLFEKSLFKDRKDEFKEARKAIDKGNDFFKEGKEEDAIESYMIAYKFNPNNAELNYKLGTCYLLTHILDNKKSYSFFSKALQLDPNIEPKHIHFALGTSMHLNGLWDKAIEEYHNHKSAVPKEDQVHEFSRVDKRIQECKNGIELQKNPIRVFVDNLGPEINGPNREYSPFITTDESEIFFTSRRPDTQGGSKEEHSDSYFEDIYKSNRLNKKWEIAKNMGQPINSYIHDATAGLSPDGKIVFMYIAENGGDLYEAEYKDGKWTKPEALNKNINTKYHETTASLSYDGKILYFVSNREDLTLGGSDIFMSKLDEKGKWGKPVNLGSTINTQYDEEGVFAHPDGKSLYFSSKGHNTMGGYDVFKSTFVNGKWGAPVNLGYPINHPADDVFFVLNASGKHGYYASTQEGGYGLEDIYMITILGPEKNMILNTEDILFSSEKQPVSDVVIEPKVPVSTNQLTLFKGRVLDSLTKEPLQANIVLADIGLNQEIGKFITDKTTGKFIVTLPSGKNYNLTAKAETYLFQSLNFDLPPGGDYQVVEKDILLNQLKVGAVIILNNIFFDHDKFTLRPESEIELQNLYKLLTDNSSMRIEISGHTDSNGKDDYNQKLSENRAGAVVKWLTEKGIPVSRLEFAGYGEVKPIATNATPEGRQLNRRTEFKILSN